MEDSREVLTRPAPPPDMTLRYGPDPDHLIDVRLPAVTPAPLVVAFHGGFWRAEYDRTHLGSLATALAAAGHVVAVPEYRRTGQRGGGWPGTFDDVAAAFDATLVRLAPYADGPPRLLGFSAGGHLALWTAARHRLDPSHRWHRSGPVAERVVALAGCSDLRRCAELGLDGGATDLLLGGPPGRVRDRHRLADPAELLPTGVPAILLHGTADDRVPIEVSRVYAERAAGQGDPVLLREIPGAGHYTLIDPRGPVWPDVLDALREPR